MVRRREEEEKFLDVNAAMQGSLVFSDPVNLRINGKFEGNLTTKGNLVIGDKADVNADIIADNLVVAGKVTGNIKAKKVSLKSTGFVLGDFDVFSLAIEDGAVFNGKCRMGGSKMSLTELSEFLSVDETKIMEWVNGGSIPAEKTVEGFLFDHSEVEGWISQNS